MEMAKILLVEDDEAFRASLARRLASEHHTLDSASTKTDGLYFATTYKYDLLILDWELPDGSGAALCRELRNRGLLVPVIMLTGRTDLADKVAGLDCGADDYVTKPCDAEELSARMRALLRRSTEGTEYRFGDITIEPVNHCMKVDGKILELPAAEFQIALLLVRSAGTPLSVDSISERASDSQVAIGKSAVKVLISRLRKRLSEANSSSTISFDAGGYAFRSQTE